MATITPVIMSGAADGVGVLVTGTNSAGADTIHAALATANVIDEIWLWAHNAHSVDVTLTIEFGEAAQPMKITIPKEDGAYAVIPGWKLTNSKSVAAFADTANVVKLTGYVNRYDPS